ncbi:MAG: DUF3048 domain-containing protein [Acidimicrobiia bacterium]|nr:DUF3048 domain-containing protein [Acidimicrobiia bacterium]
MRHTMIVFFAAGLALGACSSGNSSEESTTSQAIVVESTFATSTTAAEIPVDQEVWPLTGLPTGGEDATTAPVLIVKIDNTPSSRPQAGLAAADLVFDVLVEGGISRFLAVFQSSMPEEVGPVRSAREVDPKLIEPFGALYAYSGGQDFVVSRLRSVATDVGFPRLGEAAYYRSTQRPAPYDVILRTADVVDTEHSGLSSGLLFGDLPGNVGQPATDISLSLSSMSEVGYLFTNGSYARSVGGEPHRDEAEGPISVTNVVVVFVDVVATGRTDSAGTAVPDYDVVGSGSAIVFRDGRVIEGTWQRSTSADLFALLDGDGEQIPLAPGTTWVEVVPNGRPTTWK